MSTGVVYVSMKRKMVLSLLASALMLGTVATPVVAFADKLSDAKRKAEDLANQTKDTQQRLQDLKQQEASLQAKISDLQTQVETLQKSIVATQADISQRTAQINKLKQQITATKKVIDKQYSVLEDRIRVMYEDGNTTYLDVLFSATSFSDLLDRLQLLSLLASQDKQVLDDIRAKKAALDKQNAELNTQLQQVQASYRTLLAKKQQQESAQQRETALLKQVHSSRLQAEAELRSENAAMQNLKALIDQLESQQGSYSGPADGWTWPVPGHTFISSGYGYRTWGNGTREFHNGIDIPAPVGTPIVAATGGKVLYAGPASGFGHWIVIQSAGGLIEIYGHMYGYEIKVSPGEVVHKGQVIAGVGSDGLSTGAHLHFTIAKGFDSSGFPISVNPLNYV
jgi:murein DD-endopeptidase MepM/ murein hydrolase activator NlpD